MPDMKHEASEDINICASFEEKQVSVEEFASVENFQVL
jgi:hypothetical protein